MRKYLLGMVALLVAVVGAVSGGGVASAQAPENYSAEYNATNFYSTDGTLQYWFSGLDVNTNYSWLLQGVNADGSTGQAFEWKTSLGSATRLIQWSGAEGDFDGQDGLVYAGALRVIDSFGQVQGTHYTLPGCNSSVSIACGAATDWLVNGTAVNPAGARFGIGKRGWQLGEENAEGYFHQVQVPGIVTSQIGEITFLHYSSFLSPNTDRYYLWDIADGSTQATFSIQDFIDYNTDVRLAVLSPYFVTQSFMVLNTDGSFLPFINAVQNDEAFNKAGALGNPHELSIGVGAYDYTQTDLINAWQNDGESVWLVSNSSPNEWGIENGQNTVGESGQLRVELESSTEEIYDLAYADHRLDDSAMGLIDAADYAFQTRRHYAYTVHGVSQSGVVATWGLYPIQLTQQAASLTNRRFEVLMTYDIDINMAVKDRVENTLAGFGLDSPLGRGLGMLVLMLVGFLFIAKNGARTIVPFGLLYLVVGGGWLALGMGDTITTVLFGITAIFVIFIMINSRKSEGSFEG